MFDIDAFTCVVGTNVTARETKKKFISTEGLGRGLLFNKKKKAAYLVVVQFGWRRDELGSAGFASGFVGDPSASRLKKRQRDVVARRTIGEKTRIRRANRSYCPVFRDCKTMRKKSRKPS